ncbi:recombinase family protein [Corynebacterium imitans]|nr:recombinase family protein [Corynebacterium imitans]
MLRLMGSAAEFERSIIKERQAEGIVRAKARAVCLQGSGEGA